MSALLQIRQALALGGILPGPTLATIWPEFFAGVWHTYLATSLLTHPFFQTLGWCRTQTWWCFLSQSLHVTKGSRSSTSFFFSSNSDFGTCLRIGCNVVIFRGMERSVELQLARICWSALRCKDLLVYIQIQGAVDLHLEAKICWHTFRGKSSVDPQSDAKIYWSTFRFKDLFIYI